VLKLRHVHCVVNLRQLNQQLVGRRGAQRLHSICGDFRLLTKCKLIILYPEIVQERQTQIRAAGYVVFAGNDAIDQNMDRESVGRELSAYFFIDLHKHVV
jgi:hypothetical protein